ncbi:hypothetical protein [Candidatus Korobacter versatilis]|nr:hypothetical protein [Candidatus Koribacter versatilis]
MKRLFLLVAIAVCTLGLGSCGSQAKSNPGVDVTGNWNVDLTQNGLASPSYSFGLKLTKNGATISGTEIAYTGGSAFTNGCINLGGLTATGNTNGGNVVTLIVKDASTNSSFTISGTADSAVAQINGNFTSSFGANGSNPPCADEDGTVLMNRQ